MSERGEDLEMEDFLWRMRIWASLSLRRCCWCCGDKRNEVRREETEEMFEMRVEEIKESMKTEEKPSKTWSVSSLPVAEVRWVCVCVCVCVCLTSNTALYDDVLHAELQ